MAGRTMPSHGPPLFLPTPRWGRPVKNQKKNVQKRTPSRIVTRCVSMDHFLLGSHHVQTTTFRSKSCHLHSLHRLHAHDDDENFVICVELMQLVNFFTCPPARLVSADMDLDFRLLA